MFNDRRMPNAASRMPNAESGGKSRSVIAFHLPPSAIRLRLSAFRLLLGCALLPAFGAGCGRSSQTEQTKTEPAGKATFEVSPVGDNGRSTAESATTGGDARRTGESFTAVEASKPAPPPDKAADVAELKKLGLSYDSDANGRVTEINFNKKKATPAALRLLGRFPALEILILDKTGLTNEQLGRLKGLPKLKQLSIEENPIDDSGLAHVTLMPGLTTLSLSKTKVTGRGLRHIKGLTKLEVLNLAHCKITDDSLENLTGMKDMITLTLQNCGITGPGLKQVGKLAKMITLNLDDSKIVGQSLMHLKNCSKLRIIYMRNCTVSKRSIKRLEEEIESIAIFTDDDDE